MKIIEMQFAWFFAEPRSLDYEKIAISIREKTKRDFVSPATFIPLPPMAPPEIPRVQLNTPNGMCRVAISINRADFFVSTNSVSLSDVEIKSFLLDIQKISEIILSNITVNRLGIVGRFYKESAEPQDEIAEKLLKHKYENINEASVKITERHVADKFTFNDSYMFDMGMNAETGKKLLMVTRDINTATDVSISINLEAIKSFVVLAEDRLKEANITAVMGG